MVFSPGARECWDPKGRQNKKVNDKLKGDGGIIYFEFLGSGRIICDIYRLPDSGGYGKCREMEKSIPGLEIKCIKKNCSDKNRHYK